MELDQHIKTYRAAMELLEWMDEEGLTLERWIFRLKAVPGVGVEARGRNGEIFRNARELR